ncbi:MAG: potassium-transporting ATPase subunit KdpC [Polyangiaceae bacterium]
MRTELERAFKAFLALTALTGVAYPILVTVFAWVLFPSNAGGSLARRDGRVVASRLVGQPFHDPGHLQGRPSATPARADGASEYVGESSSGSNLGPTNPALTERARATIDRLRAENPEQDAPIPVDLVTASASGLDPDVSFASARWQVPRIARARGVPRERVLDVFRALVREPPPGLPGSRTVNVVDANLALDAMK